MIVKKFVGVHLFNNNKKIVKEEIYFETGVIKGRQGR